MKKLLLVALAMIFVAPAMAQESQWGPEWGDSAADRDNNVLTFNLYRPAVTRADWGMAAHYLHELMAKVPAAHPAIYTLAIDMYRKRADAATDSAEKLVMVDSLLMMHDKYVEMFPDVPQVPQVLNNKAVFIRQYYGNDKTRVLDAFRKGVEIAGGSMPSLLVSYFNELTAAYKSEDVPVDGYLSEYGRLSGELEEAGATEQQEQLMKLLVSSGAADCTNVETVYRTRIAADPENTKLLDEAIALMNHSNCMGEFYMEVAEKLYKVAPTAMIARIIAASYKANGDEATAAKFIQEAISLANTPEEKTEVLLGVASDELLAKNYRSAYNHAHEVAQINPQNVTAHYLMALATAGGASGCSDAMAQRASYWLAYDRMQEARRLAAADSSTKEETMRNIESSLAQFAAAFPSTEEVFLQGLNEGSAYTVNCGWISGRTTVRNRP